MGWVSKMNLEDELEPSEAEFLASAHPPETSEMTRAVWRVEGLAVLAWALGLSELPRYDELATPPKLWECFGLLDPEKSQELLVNARLLPKAKLNTQRRSLLAFHWRMTQFRVAPAALDFPAIQKRGEFFRQFDLSSFDLVQGDLALNNLPISEADPEDVMSAGSVAQERHLAITWLGDASDPYSETMVMT